MTLQAGLRTLHEAGPELKRTISGNLDEIVTEAVEPMHRVSEIKIMHLRQDFSCLEDRSRKLCHNIYLFRHDCNSGQINFRTGFILSFV